MSEEAIREIIYAFGDASVPPQYHRSYTITVTPGAAALVVDSYGAVLAEKTYEITPERFREIVASLKRRGIEHAALEDDDGCTGGTTETVSLSNGEKEVFSATVYHCGGRDSGNLGGDVKGFADDVRELTPDLAELLK